MSTEFNSHCPVPITAEGQRISLAHGEGARLTRQLLQTVIQPRLGLHGSDTYADAAVIRVNQKRLAVCTDSHTVTPLFFPGGDLGSLSVYGTVNDLAVAGAIPRWLTFSLIIEEGLPVNILERLIDSAGFAAGQCGVSIVAGDTKVVPRGAADGLFINTAGVGELVEPIPAGPAAIQANDVLLVSGPVGRHGIAVLSAREGFLFDTTVTSDSGSVLPQVAALRRAAADGVRAIRDATRGGISAVLHEWAAIGGMTFALEESAIPVTAGVRGACELLGLDPLYVANEGTIVAAVDPRIADTALEKLRSVPGCEQAAIIGRVVPQGICPVVVRRALGTLQPLDEPSGAPLPRIC